MEHKWHVRFLLKNGERLYGIYCGPEKTPYEVSRALLHNISDACFTECKGVHEVNQLFVRVGEIVSVEIKEV